MNDTEKQKTATETIRRAEMERDIVFLHRFRWGIETPKLRRLLHEMYSANEPPSAPAPVIEISFQDARYYLLPEYIADFALRLYSDYINRRPPFTQKRLDALRDAMECSTETLLALEQILFGGDDTENIPQLEKAPDA